MRKRFQLIYMDINVIIYINSSTGYFHEMSALNTHYLIPAEDADGGICSRIYILEEVLSRGGIFFSAVDF